MAVGVAAAMGLTAANTAGGASGSASAPSAKVSTDAERPPISAEARSLLAARQVVGDVISRSSARPPLRSSERATKTAALPVTQQNLEGARTVYVPPPSPREIAMSLLPSYGWDSSQFSCLDSIWTRESNWDPHVANSSSGAYGIPQALPGSKMATAGSDWVTNPVTQIRWGLGYIRASYGSPCSAWYFWESHNWY